MELPPNMQFNGKSGNNGFRAEIGNSSNLLDDDGGTIYAITSWTGSHKNERGVCGYFENWSDNNEFSLHQHTSYFRAHTNYKNAAEANWINPITTKPAIRTIQFESKEGSFTKRNEGELRNYFNHLANGITNYNTYLTGSIGSSSQNWFGIGEIPQTGQFYKGLIAEVIVFGKDKISNQERLRTESYLAIKYGITLGTKTSPVSYVSSNDKTPQIIWQAEANFQNDIIGIGRDDVSTLNQKQSQQRDDSVRIYLGDLSSTNLDNKSTFNKDKSFVMMGSNDKKLNATDASNMEMYAGNAQSNCNLFSVIERKWKVQRTNMDEQFNIEIKLSSDARLNLIDKNDLRLIVDTDNDLSNGWEECYEANSTPGFDIIYDDNNGLLTLKGINTTQFPNNEIRYFSIGSIDGGSPLPIELSSYKSHCKNQITELCWTTASETNNDYFTIEKSSDGKNFRPMTTIEGQGNKNTESHYNYHDYERTVGLSYYRLSQTDFDGEETVLETISSNCEGAIEVILHPNPTNSGVNVTLNGTVDESFELHVYNLLGKRVSSNHINGSTWISLPDEKGVYIFKYILDNKKKVKKVVKY